MNCTQTDFIFLHASILQTHMEKPKLICEECAKDFRHHYDLEQHMDTVHGRTVNLGACSYRCTHCQESFNSHWALLAHVKQHQKDKLDAPRLCEICA